MRAVAHTPRDGSTQWHDLSTHLHDTARLASRFATKFQSGELAYIAGLVHDIGKYNPAFQRYLHDAHAGREATSVPHAVYGGLAARDAGLHALAFTVHGDHTQMPAPGDLQNSFRDREIATTYDVVRAAAKAGGWELNGHLVDPSIFRRDLDTEMLLRMVFSCLVDADYLDTEAHFDPDRAALRTPAEHRPSGLLATLIADQERIMSGAAGAVNVVRTEVYEACLSAAASDRSVFRLVAPTGAGKTRSALAFGLAHALRHDHERVIFAVPYLSITDQVAQVAREIFGDDAVLEHHSGVLTREPTDRNRLATQNWDAPLIVTTTVQLLESLLSSRPSRCRKLHNIARSVIVLDEVQTLPVRMLQPAVSVLNELVQRYGCSVVLSTATQPALEVSSRFLQGFDTVVDIVAPETARQHFRKLRRVRYEVDPNPASWGRIAAAFGREKRAMIVVNTRADARDLHMAATALDVRAEHLSASMCGAHRAEVLREVRRKLDAGEECRLISTQVIEAGVDVDFETVFSAFGPLDSIVQAAGRCNREGKLTEGRVVVFEPSEGGKLPGKDYSTATYTASNMLRRGTDLHDPSVFRSYFEKMYQLGTDEKGIQVLRKQFDYPEVAARFRIVDDAQQDVIIPYDDRARSLIERIRSEEELRPGDLRRLQRYTVGLYPKDFDKASPEREEIAEGLWLWTGRYADVRGLEMI